MKKIIVCVLILMLFLTIISTGCIRYNVITTSNSEFLGKTIFGSKEVRFYGYAPKTCNLYTITNKSLDEYTLTWTLFVWSINGENLYRLFGSNKVEPNAEENNSYSCIIEFSPFLRNRIIYYQFRASYQNYENNDTIYCYGQIKSIDLSKY